MEIIAVDPDVEFNGIAKFDTETKAISVAKMTMPQLTEYMRANGKNIKKSLLRAAGLTKNRIFTVEISEWHKKLPMQLVGMLNAVVLYYNMRIFII